MQKNGKLSKLGGMIKSSKRRFSIRKFLAGLGLFLAGGILMALHAFFVYAVYHDTTLPSVTYTGNISEIRSEDKAYIFLQETGGPVRELEITTTAYTELNSVLGVAAQPQKIARNQVEVKVSPANRVRQIGLNLPRPTTIQGFSTNFGDYLAGLALNFAGIGIGLLVIIAGGWYWLTRSVTEKEMAEVRR